MSIHEVRLFTLGQILNITTGIFCTRDFGDVYDILNFLTQDDLYTTQLGNAKDETVPYILEQHPALKVITAAMLLTDCEGLLPPACAERVFSNVATLVKAYGDSFALHPIHLEDHEQTTMEESVRRLGYTGEIIEVDFSEGDLPERP